MFFKDLFPNMMKNASNFKKEKGPTLALLHGIFSVFPVANVRRTFQVAVHLDECRHKVSFQLTDQLIAVMETRAVTPT